MNAPRRTSSRGLVERWEDYWFRPVPSDVFACLRIAFGLVGLGEVVLLLPISMFWQLGGLIPVSGPGKLLWDAVASVGLGSVAGWVIFVYLVVSFACMTVGFATGRAVAFCFAGAVFHSFWNPMPLSGAHEVLTVMLFCLLWADCSGRPSVDAWLAARRGDAPAVQRPWQAIAPLRLMRIQVALIYMNSALWKLFGPTWRDGSTVHYVLNLNGFQRFPGTVPASVEPFLTFATYGTVFWEMTFGLMLFNRWTRRFALITGVILHVSLGVALELGNFSFVILSSYIAFADPEDLSRVMTTKIWSS